MIYLYGILAAGGVTGESPPGVTGPVEEAVLPEGRLLHGRHDGTEILPRRRLMLAHARVLEDAAARGTVLPMRFGMLVEDLGAVADLISAQSARIAAEMERLSGTVEYGVRVTFDRDPALAALLADEPTLLAERDALKRRRAVPQDCASFGRRIAEALDRRRGQAQKRLLAAIRPAIVDHVLRAPETDVQVLAADILLRAESSDWVAGAVLDAARECGFSTGEPHVRLVGPQPAYSFTRLTLAARKAA
ncbi:gas vesicle protein [Roseivivax halodurans JCM 10272]|uniref:Gas vesicle protein n=1 Tax=Roseivivax halodurans JCM 10272 TaxID=1449350 RepID=X7EJ00_9RHOB|nr:GvpL/GvpF family gas vesicle protein [Roseivivax halodurans]ETX15867.1 gas vesicle protein [Roseivivax halodurans JCM 10272]